MMKRGAEQMSDSVGGPQTAVQAAQTQTATSDTEADTSGSVGEEACDLTVGGQRNLFGSDSSATQHYTGSESWDGTVDAGVAGNVVAHSVSTIVPSEAGWELTYNASISGMAFKMILVEGGKKSIVKPASHMGYDIARTADGSDHDIAGNSNSHANFVREFIGSRVYFAIAKDFGFEFPAVSIIKLTNDRGEHFALKIDFIEDFKTAKDEYGSGQLVKGARNSYQHYATDPNFYCMAIIRLMLGDTDFTPENSNADFGVQIDAGLFGKRKFDDAFRFKGILGQLIRCNWHFDFNEQSETFQCALRKLEEVDRQALYGKIANAIDDAIAELKKAGAEARLEGLDSVREIDNKSPESFANLDEYAKALKDNLEHNLTVILPAFIKEYKKEPVVSAGAVGAVSSSCGTPKTPSYGSRYTGVMQSPTKENDFCASSASTNAKSPAGASTRYVLSSPEQSGRAPLSSARERVENGRGGVVPKKLGF